MECHLRTDARNCQHAAKIPVLLHKKRFCTLASGGNCSHSSGRASADRNDVKIRVLIFNISLIVCDIVRKHIVTS
jgi:hypothetical protein